MADGGWAEVKAAVEEGNQAVAQVRALADELKGRVDSLDAEKLGAAKAELAETLQAEAKALAARLDAVETRANRPGDIDGQKREPTEYEKKFLGYIRGSVEGSELKAMSTDVDPNGGFLVTPTMSGEIMRRIRRTSPMRAVARAVIAETYEALIERGDAGFEWTGETTPRNQTATPTINKVTIPVHELSAKAPVTQRMLDNANLDIEGFVTDSIEDKFARAEATAFITGDGVSRPKGITVYSTVTADDASRANGKLQHRVTGENGAFPPLDAAAGVAGADPLVRLFYDLQPAYQANATWMMKNTVAADVALLKNADGSYLLREMLNADGTLVRTIQGRPVVLADDMPAATTGSLSVAVGDFMRGYTIVDNGSIRLLRDPFTAKPNVLFYMTRRVGGGVVDFDAIKFLKFSA